MNFLKNLDFLMEKNKINRTELAKHVGIAPSTINSWYNRGYENISLKTLIKLTNFLNVTIDQLVKSKAIPDLVFSAEKYTENELATIKKFAIFLIESRLENDV